MGQHDLSRMILALDLIGNQGQKKPKFWHFQGSRQHLSLSTSLSQQEWLLIGLSMVFLGVNNRNDTHIQVQSKHGKDEEREL